MMKLVGKTIVAIDDAASIRTFLRISLEARGAKVYEASTAMEGVSLCQQYHPDLVVLDLGLPDRDGLDILPEIMTAGEGLAVPPHVVVLTVRKDREDKETARERGARHYITKPFTMDELMHALEKPITSYPTIQ